METKGRTKSILGRATLYTVQQKCLPNKRVVQTQGRLARAVYERFSERRAF